MVWSPQNATTCAFDVAPATQPCIPVPSRAARSPAGRLRVARRAPMADSDPLVRRAQRGEPLALRELLTRYRDDVARVAFRALGPNPDLEDVVQEALVQIYRSLPSYQGQSKFSTWLYRVVTNVARMHLRRQRSRPQLTSASNDALERQPAAAGERPDADAERSERLRLLYAHLSALSDKKRTVLVLHDFAGVPAAEIAAIVDAPVLTVRTRLFYARKELYAALARDPTLGELLALPRGQAGEDPGG
jgi:RNA polymerase sigma-70 factor, ECF subfamily